MPFKLYVFDLDETLWCTDQEGVEPFEGPFQLEESHLARSENSSVRLRQGTRRLLKAIHRNGGIASLACRSEEETSNEILEVFGIRDRFFQPRYGLQEKGEAILEILSEIREKLGVEISVEEVLFVDDAPANTAEAQRVGAKALLYGRDLRNLSELKRWVS
ncbi:MAG: magnesium-dependent phosphatase-1 [Planctomycetia bacterium TMED53]|nr:MAG: magnesium-dependent phosphatase-1 [Planctomycetia bacterium TMED53]